MSIAQQIHYVLYIKAIIYFGKYAYLLFCRELHGQTDTICCFCTELNKQDIMSNSWQENKYVYSDVCGDTQADGHHHYKLILNSKSHPSNLNFTQRYYVSRIAPASSSLSFVGVRALIVTHGCRDPTLPQCVWGGDSWDPRQPDGPALYCQPNQ